MKGQTPYLSKYVETLGFFLSTLKTQWKINNTKKKKGIFKIFFFLIAEEKDEKSDHVISDSVLPFRWNFR